MKIFNLFFLKENNEKLNKDSRFLEDDQYREISKLVKEARIKNQLSIKDLSKNSKIPESTINSIEQNIEHLRPEYPFIRSILLKLEECLYLKKNTLLALSNKKMNSFQKVNKNFVIRKFDLINSWQGCFLYFIFLILTLFLINRYFIYSTETIEIKIIEEKSEKI